MPQYKLVFMDLNMPEMNGLEATMLLRDLQNQGELDLSETKIVLYSCLANTSDLREINQYFDAVADKPINVENMRTILRDCKLIQ